MKKYYRHYHTQERQREYMKISLIKWHDIETPPDREGEFLVLDDVNIDARAVLYTPEGGWNTYRDLEGILHADNPIEAVEWRKQHYKMWADLPSREGLF